MTDNFGLRPQHKHTAIQVGWYRTKTAVTRIGPHRSEVVATSFAPLVLKGFTVRPDEDFGGAAGVSIPAPEDQLNRSECCGVGRANFSPRVTKSTCGGKGISALVGRL